MKKTIYLLMLTITLLSCSKKMIISGEDEDLLKEYINQYESGDWQKRRGAVKEISGFRSAMAIDLLLKATDDVHQSVVIESLKGFSRLLPESALEKVKYIAEFARNDNVRWYALKVLAKYRDSASAPIFVIGLNNKDWLIREESVKGLLMIDDYAIKYVSIPYIIEALNDKKINVIITTLEKLDIKDERLYNTIINLLPAGLNYNNSLLKSILKALKGYRLDKNTRKTLLNLMTHQNTQIRLLAFRVLREEKR